jgi:hypothetical protein
LLDSSQIFPPTVIINSFICGGTYDIFDTPSAWPAVLAEGGLRGTFGDPLSRNPAQKNSSSLGKARWQESLGISWAEKSLAAQDCSLVGLFFCAANLIAS